MGDRCIIARMMAFLCWDKPHLLQTSYFKLFSQLFDFDPCFVQLQPAVIGMP